MFKFDKNIKGRRMSTLVLATAVSIATGQNAYQTRAGALIDASYSCLAASCPESFGECRAQTHAGPNVAPENTPGGSCNTMLDCHEQCQAEPSKSATLACNQLCLDEIEPNARILYDGVQQCFATWCTAEHLAQDCHGWPDLEACEAISTCHWNSVAESCSTEDLTAPTFVNCPARDIVVNTKQTSADNVARWVELRAVDRGVDAPVTQFVGTQSSGDHFSVGTTDLGFRSTDPAGNSVECHFAIVVNDVWPPIISHCPADLTFAPDAEDFVIGLNGEYLYNTTWVWPIAHDYVGFEWTDSPTENHGRYPLGSSPVQYTATDAAGNVAQCSFTITVLTPYQFYFSETESSIVADLNGEDTPTAENGILVQFTGVDANGCAQRCHAEVTRECTMFLMSRDGAGTCILLSKPMATTDLTYSADWNIFVGIWEDPARPADHNYAHCPGLADADACAVADSGFDNADAAACTGAVDAFNACAAVNLHGSESCRNTWALQLETFRSGHYANLCTADPAAYPGIQGQDRSCPSQVAVGLIEECIACCKAATSTDVCRVSKDGVLAEPDADCAALRHGHRTACNTGCVPEVSIFEAGGSPPTGLIDVFLNFRLDAPGVTDTDTPNLDSVSQAAILTAAQRTFGFDLDTTSVQAVSTEEDGILVQLQARVAETQQLPDPAHTEADLWTYSIPSTSTWEDKARDLTIASNSSNLVSYVPPFELRILADTSAFSGITIRGVSSVSSTYIVSETFSVVSATPSPTEPVKVGSTDAPETTTQATLNIAGDVSASSGKSDDDTALSSSIVSVIVIAVVFVLLVTMIVYACYRRPNKVAPMAPSFSAPDPVRSLPPGQGMAPPGMIGRGNALSAADPFEVSNLQLGGGS